MESLGLIDIGKHGTRKCAYQDWNGELFKVICADLDLPFELLHNSQCDDLARHIAERVGDTVDRLNTALNGRYQAHNSHQAMLNKEKLIPAHRFPALSVHSGKI
jgi:hypothetical protein